jgi:hypothetical protein
VDGSAFATDLTSKNCTQQPYNVFVVDDDDARQDYGIGPVLHAHRNKILDASNSSRSLPVYYVAVVWPMDGGNDFKDHKFYLANCKPDQSKLERVVFGPKLIGELQYVTGYVDKNKHRWRMKKYFCRRDGSSTLYESISIQTSGKPRKDAFTHCLHSHRISEYLSFSHLANAPPTQNRP